MTAQADRIRRKRRAFAAPGSSLDRMVQMLAVGLPALVGVVAAMMVITPLGPRGEVSFLLDRNEVAIAEDRLRVDNAVYRGEDSRGRPFSLAAGNAVQESSSVAAVELRELVARIILPEGPAVLSASAGIYDIDEQQVQIPSIVRFRAADGYSMAARDVTVDLPSRTLWSEGPVEGAVPAGTFGGNSFRADLAERTVTIAGDARMRMVPGQLRLPSGM